MCPAMPGEHITVGGNVLHQLKNLNLQTSAPQNP